MNRLWTIFLFVFFGFDILGQRIITEIDMPSRSRVPEYFECIPLHDSLIISYRIPMPIKTEKEFNTLLILPDGTKKILADEILKDKVLAGVASDGQEKLFYFLDFENKSIVVKAVKRNLVLNKEVLLSESVAIPGKLIGAAVRNNALYVYAFEKKKSYMLKVIKIDKLQVSEQKDYPLSVDLSKFKRSEISFIPENVPLGPEKIITKVKIFLQGETIAFVVDEPFDEFDKTQQLFKTTVIRINTITDQVQSRFFAETRIDRQFRSAIHGEYFFRTINNKKEFTLQVYDLNNGKQLINKVIPDDAAAEKFKVIYREGRANNKITRIESLSYMMYRSKEYYPYVVVNEDSLTNTFLLTWGVYWDENFFAPAIPLSPAYIITASVGNLIAQTLNGPGISMYFYLEGSVTTDFKITDRPTIGIGKHKTDAFERDLNQKLIKYKVKGYQEFNGGLIGIYYFPESDKVRFVEFQ